MTFTGQSLLGPDDSTVLLKLADLAYDVIPSSSEQVSAAGRVQGLALQYGAGRVVVVGDAACLTVQGQIWMNAPGTDNRQMALNIIRWLSGLFD